MIGDLVAALGQPEDWTLDALCAQMDGDLFYPEQGGPTRDAKAVCAVCPARRACLEYALEHDIRYGIWGGVAERDRRRIKRDREAAATTAAA